MCSNCLVLLTLGVVANRVRTCASLLRLKSIIRCSRNIRIGKFPALQCVWKHIANSIVPKVPRTRKEPISHRLGFSTASAPFHFQTVLTKGNH